MSQHVIREQRGNVIVYRLQNFHVNDFMPKPEHEVPLAGEITTEIMSVESPVALIGHASRTGREDSNKALSQQRAETVREFLTSQNVVPHKRLVVMSVGESPRKPDGVEDPTDRAVRVVITGPVPDADRTVDEPSGQMSVPRPSNTALLKLMESNPGVNALFNEHLIYTFVPDMLNILGPSSAGVQGGPLTLLDVFFHGNQAVPLLEATRPTDPERFNDDQERILTNVWSDYLHLLEVEGLSFNENHEIINRSGEVVERPFRNIDLDD